jgi:hypothetical protein
MKTLDAVLQARSCADLAVITALKRSVIKIQHS